MWNNQKQQKVVFLYVMIFLYQAVFTSSEKISPVMIVLHWGFPWFQYLFTIYNDFTYKNTYMPVIALHLGSSCFCTYFELYYSFTNKNTDKSVQS